MIVACQVMDPGSIPGERNFFLSVALCPSVVGVVFFFEKKVGTMGIEPMTNGLLDQRSTD